MQDEWGITDGYHDVGGTWHPTADAVRARLREAMGEPEGGMSMWFVEAGTEHHLWGSCEVHLEQGGVIGPTNHLAGDLPIGYHDLVPVDGAPRTRLIVHPLACPPIPRAWGVAAQIYALWSERSWGIGDLGDVRALAEAVVAAGGSTMLLSPLHQAAPSVPQEPSPYYPSSRRAWNPLLLALDAPPPHALRCSPDDLIDRDAAWRAKRAVLWARFEASAAADPAGMPRPGAVAVWNARCEELGPNWREWPDPLPSPDTDADLLRRAQFHEWLQEQIADQLDAVAATGIRLIGDLAVGFGPDGADADEFRDLLALDMRIGAPPDEFNTAGQDWGIPPFVPWRLRAACYEPFIATVRASLLGVHGLRIDHVMGLFRQYWVPSGSSPHEGAYVRFPAHELLAIIALEATRAGAFVIGEDLGTVEPTVREMLAARRIAGTKVLWFEPGTPDTWPEHCLATVTTHDLPTIAQVFDAGPDTTGTAAEEAVQRRLHAVAAGAPDAAAAITAAHDALLASPARLRLVTTDDLAGADEQPNLPGTNDYPSWRKRLPRPVADLLRP